MNAALYVSLGSELRWYEVDVDLAALTPGGAVQLPADVQYAWPHPRHRWLYVASSSGGPGKTGDAHHLSAFTIDAESGALSAHGELQALAARPVHCCVDRAGEFILTAYNNPSAVRVHRILPDGSVGDEVPQLGFTDPGIYAHQVRGMPSNRAAILVTRGNHGKPDEPGALKVLTLDGGRLTSRHSIAPGGGRAFRPRHVDFHPSQPWVYVAIERPPEIQMFDCGPDDRLVDQPRFSKTTLAHPTGPGDSGAGAIHFHPSGQTVYVSNRRLGVGQDSIAVFTIDPVRGEPTLIQSVDPRVIHVRTFSIDPSGRLVIAASIAAYATPSADGAPLAPDALSLFRIAPAGTLEFARKYDIETGSDQMFWSGMVGLG